MIAKLMSDYDLAVWVLDYVNYYEQQKCHNDFFQFKVIEINPIEIIPHRLDYRVNAKVQIDKIPYYLSLTSHDLKKLQLDTGLSPKSQRVVSQISNFAQSRLEKIIENLNNKQQ